MRQAVTENEYSVNIRLKMKGLRRAHSQHLSHLKKMSHLEKYWENRERDESFRGALAGQVRAQSHARRDVVLVELMWNPPWLGEALEPSLAQC